MITVAVVAEDPRARTLLRMILPPSIRLLEDISILDPAVSVLWQRPDAVIVDSDEDPETLRWMVQRVHSLLKTAPVIVISADSCAQTIVGVIQGGAFDYVTRPYNLERLLGSIQRAAIFRASQYACDTTEADTPASEQFLGASKLACEVRETITAFSELDAPVLLCGESGVGKDLVARLIHTRSGRSGRPYRAVNCAAIPDTIVESELFGSERGAFTDAVTRAGIFEQCYGGTLFLDEIGEASPHLQAKLLRALESSSIVRVGGSRPTPVDFRIITATNRHLRQRVTDGGFRDDLYYRIGVLPLWVPPLRERVEDIPVIAWHRLRQQTQGSIGFSPEAMQRLVEHSWPGNVRELFNVIQRGILFSKGGTIEARHIMLDSV